MELGIENPSREKSEFLVGEVYGNLARFNNRGLPPDPPHPFLSNNSREKFPLLPVRPESRRETAAGAGNCIFM